MDFLNEPNLIIALVIVSVATIYCYYIGYLLKFQLKPAKFETIDGLRGYLAFLVFMHHANIYYYYFKNKTWDLPNQKLFIHFGQTSVSLFFMITGFLFFNKLIESRSKKIDWQQFYISRILRLYPLYILVLIIIILIIAVSSDFRLNEPLSDIFSQLKDWFFFTAFNAPTINKFEKTMNITCYVLWTLKYEWFYYFSLPLIGLLFFKQRPSLFVLLISSYVCYSIYMRKQIEPIYLLSFLSGLLAVLINRITSLKKYIIHPVSSILVIMCLVYMIEFYYTAYDYIPLLLITIVFIIISNGNSIFGLLTSKASRLLGQLSYSIYLMHAPLLYIMFKIIFEIQPALVFSLYGYWTVIAGFSVLLISICHITYYKIELPMINSTIKISNKVNEIRNSINKLYYKL